MTKQLLFYSAIMITVLFSNYRAYSQYQPYQRAFTTKSMVIAQHGMVCTSQPLATFVGLEILKAGGTAIDAAIAANAVLGVTEPHSDGMGGDIFAIVYDARSAKLYGLNGSGRSPYTQTLEELKKGS